MDAFEELVAEILRADGWWVHHGYRIVLSPDEKRALDNPSMPRPEIEQRYRGHAGLPQVNLPLAVVDGRPVGLSLVAARGNDLLLLELACRLRGALRTGPVKAPA